MVTERPSGPGRPQVVAVLVTWQRLDLLRDALPAVLQQSRPPDVVVVVDNASTDGTAEWVAAAHPEVDLLRLRHNTGGAGGFAAGVQRALDHHAADLLWLLDDDTLPRPGALEALVRRQADPASGRPALVASRVVWTDGRDHPMNTPRTSPLATAADRRRAASSGCTPVRSASFVSVLLDAASVRCAGPPIADYFLWNDDFEFTARLLRGRLGLLDPSSVVEHRTRTFGSTDVDPGDRFYFEVRNKVWLFTRSPALRPAERVLYGGATVLRWSRTVRRSSDRRRLLRAAARGSRDGLRSGPRTNEQVLGSAVADSHG